MISEAGISYSTRPMGGDANRTELPTQWHDDTAFTVDWSPVCRHWGNAATFREHYENGVRGLQEDARHFWRYDRAAAQHMQDTRRSTGARPPKSHPVPSRPTGTSTPHAVVATAKSGALSSPSQRPGTYKTCLEAFNPEEYGTDYLRLSAGDVIQDVEAPEASEDWAYGCLVLSDDRLSAPGWYPRTYARRLGASGP